MEKITGKADEGRMISESESALDQLIRKGARKLLQSALDNEVAEFIERMKSRRTEEGLREIVRNKHSPELDIINRAGPLRIKQPRVRDRKSEARFTSRIVYWWADGIYFNVQLDPERPCLLVEMVS